MNYGYKNVKPTVGGFLYGQYLHSHNVNPQRGMQPEYRQVYKNAQMFGDRVPPHPAPQIPRPKPPSINEEKVMEGEMKRNPLEAEKLNSEEKKKTRGASATVRPASAGRKPSGSGTGMQASAGKQQFQSNIQKQQIQGQAPPKITIAPADLDKNKAQMSAGEKERLMAKVGKDGGYPGNNNKNLLSPQDANKTVKIGNNKGGVAAPQVGFIDQLSETKKAQYRKDSGHESNYGGASSIEKHAGYDDFLEMGSGSGF